MGRPVARDDRSAGRRDEELLRGLEDFGDHSPAQMEHFARYRAQDLAHVVEFAVVQQEDGSDFGVVRIGVHWSVLQL